MSAQRLILWSLALAILSWGIWGCSRADNQHTNVQKNPPDLGTTPISGSAPATANRDVVEYKLVGEVKKVDKEAREVTIHHQAIPGFMEAMTMPFHLEDAAVLDDLRQGDEVEGKLRVEREKGEVTDYRLHDLTVTKPALAAPLVLDLSGGTPKLVTRPRRLEPGELVADFTLTGQDGQTFKLSDLRGHVVVLTFIYTRCPLPDFCPYMDRKFADLANTLAAFPRRAEAVRLLSISFDPDHDTPEILRKHAQTRGASPPLWRFAVASHDQLGRIAPQLGLIYGPTKDQIIHNLCTAVIDQQGKLVRLEVGTQSNKWSSADLLKTVYSLISPVHR
ncbi:MAG: SCO family protein [Isosphaeraceae bacterium]